MLLGKNAAPGQVVAVMTRNEQFSRLLSEILTGWKYRVVESPAEASVTLVERGLSVEEVGGKFVWLSPMPVGDDPHLVVPLSLAELYRLLEEHFFDRPRQHIRVALDQDVDLYVDGRWLLGRITSLSDRGGRLSCAGDLSKGQPLEIVLKIDKRSLRLPAVVLYQIPAGDVPGRELPQIGIQFKPLDQGHCLALRYYIERATVDSACRQISVDGTDPCLSWFDLARDPWRSLS
jgi:hypothetical protein